MELPALSTRIFISSLLFSQILRNHGVQTGAPEGPKKVAHGVELDFVGVHAHFEGIDGTTDIAVTSSLLGKNRGASRNEPALTSRTRFTSHWFDGVVRSSACGR